MTEPVEPLVFERRLSPRAIVGLVAALGVGLGLHLAEQPLGDQAVRLAAALPAAPPEAVLRTVVRCSSPTWMIVWLAGVGFVLPRRFGRVEVWPDVLVFSRGIVPGRWGAIAVPLPDVCERAVTAHGVRVWSRGLDPLVSRLRPLVVPAADGAAAARIHALLDPPAPGTMTSATAGRPIQGWAGLLGLLWFVALMLSAPLALHVGGPSAGLGLAVGLPALLWLISEARLRWGRVHAGVATLSVLEHVVPWGRVRACALARGWLAVEVDDGRRLRLRIGHGSDAEGLRTQAATRLAEVGRPLLDVLPAWAARRPGRALLGLTLLAVPFSPFLHAVTRRATHTRVDHLGQTIHVLYRVWDGAPERVVMVVDPAVALVGTATLAARGLDAASPELGAHDTAAHVTAAHVDLVSGRARLADGRSVELPDDATVLVLGPTPGALAVSRRPLDPSEQLAAFAPGLLPAVDPLVALIRQAFLDIMAQESSRDLVERVFPRTEDPLLVAVREGRAARQCVRSSGPDGQLLVRLELGQVTACAIVPPKLPGGAGCPVCRLAPSDGQLLVRRASGEEARGRLPTWEEARAAIDAVAASSTVERATRAWAPPP